MAQATLDNTLKLYPAKDYVSARAIVREVAQELETPSMEEKMHDELLAVNGVVNCLQFRQLPKEEVIKKITHVSHCNYGRGVVDRIHEKLFLTEEDCAPAPAHSGLRLHIRPHTTCSAKADLISPRIVVPSASIVTTGSQPPTSTGEKKFPYANQKLVTVLNGQQAVSEMNLPHRVMEILVLALACTAPNYTTAVSTIFKFWICGFGSVYICGLGKRRVAVRARPLVARPL